MPIRHVALVLLICFAWGGNFLFSALALREIPPFLFTALRLGLLIPLLSPWLRRPPTGQGWRLL
ncbi:MAG: EamA family transporter, partial [Lysobacteraceae bacterium]